MNDTLEAAPIYSRLAEDLVTLINTGQLRPGERLPSVRTLSQQRKVSATTAVAALRALEMRGLVEARPQSGYFVRASASAAPMPAMTRLSTQARRVGIDTVMVRMIEASGDPGIAPLGAATADPACFPAKRLQRSISSTLRRRPRLLVEYALFAAGTDALRHQIARRYAELGCAVREDEIIVTNGCMEALNLALQTLTKPGDTIAIESPCYYGLLQVIQSLGLKALEIATHPGDGLSVDALEEALQRRDKDPIKACLVSANFSNPMGATMPDAQKRRLVELCERHDIPLIEDDIYGDLQHSGSRPRPARAFDKHHSVLLCSSFSKTLAPGARIGWICAGRRAEEIRMRKFATSIATPALLQDTLADILAAGGYERHLLKLRRAFATQVAQVSAAVCAHFPAGTRITRPRGGLLIWVELPRGIDTLALYDQALAEGVNFAPGPLFSPSGRYRNFLRLNCGRTMTPAIDHALMKLGKLMQRAL
jgi:DNA-binding transcriptional MocR family regulator